MVQAPVGVGGGTGEDHLSAGDVDEKQHVVPAEQGGVHGEEAAGDGGLGVQELRPSDLRSIWGWVDAVGFEDLPDGRGGNAVAEPDEFAVNASVTLGRIL